MLHVQGVKKNTRILKNQKRVLICFKLANFLQEYPPSADFGFQKKIFNLVKNEYLRRKMPKIEFSRGSMIRWWQNFFLHYFLYFFLKLAVITTKNVKKVVFCVFYQNTGSLSIFTTFVVIFCAFFIFSKNLMKMSPKMQVFVFLR